MAIVGCIDLIFQLRILLIALWTIAYVLPAMNYNHELPMYFRLWTIDHGLWTSPWLLTIDHGLWTFPWLWTMNHEL